MDAGQEASRSNQMRYQRAGRFQHAQQPQHEAEPEPPQHEPEPEPEPEREPEREPEPDGQPRIKSLEEMSTDEMVAKELEYATRKKRGLSKVEMFDTFVNVDKVGLKKELRRAEAISVRNSEEVFVQEAFDEMITAGKITQEEIDEKVDAVIVGTKCGMKNARRILLDHDMDVNASIEYYISAKGESTLLTTAAGELLGHSAVAQAELERERRKRFEPTEPGKLLCIAAARGDLELMERLLNEGVSPNSRDPIGGYPALHYAAEFNHVPAIMMLLRRGCDIDAKDEWGQMTAYTWGSVAGSGDAVTCLLRAGCRMEAQDVIGRTGDAHARVRQHDGVNHAISVEMSRRRCRALHRHYSTMIKRPEKYPAIRDPTIVVPTIAEEEAQRARDQVAKTIAKMLAAAGPLGTVRDRAQEVGMQHTLDVGQPMPPQDARKAAGATPMPPPGARKVPGDSRPVARRSNGPLIDTPMSQKSGRSAAPTAVLP
jgi:hypothetical protein